MPGLVKEVTERDDASSLSREVDCQPRRVSGKHSGNGIQLLAAIAEIISSHNEVGCAERCIGRKQNTIFTVPKPMAGSLWQRHRLNRPHERSRFNGRGPQQGQRDFLRPRGAAESNEYQQYRCFRCKNSDKPGCPHDYVSEGPDWPLVQVLTHCRLAENGPSVLGMGTRESERGYPRYFTAENLRRHDFRKMVPKGKA